MPSAEWTPEGIRQHARLVMEETINILTALYGSVPEWAICREMVKNISAQRQPRVDVMELMIASAYLRKVVRGAVALHIDKVEEIIKENMGMREDVRLKIEELLLSKEAP